MASRPAASIPADTASLRLACSSMDIVGKAASLPGKEEAWEVRLCLLRGPSVRGKFSRRLGDLMRVWHEELLLRGVERHRRDIRPGDPYDRAVQVAKSVLGDDGGDLRSKP